MGAVIDRHFGFNGHVAQPGDLDAQMFQHGITPHGIEGIKGYGGIHGNFHGYSGL
jgi:hypothetical protein